MDNLSVHLKSIYRYTVILFIVCGILYLLLSQYRPYILGFVVGTAVGLINAQYLAMKIVQQTATDEHKQHKRVNFISIGFVTRASMAVLAALLAIRTAYFEVSTMILGLIAVPIIALVAGLIALRNNNS